jgi:hypothetical protein
VSCYRTLAPQLHKLCEASRGNMGGTTHSRTVRSREPGALRSTRWEVEFTPNLAPAQTVEHQSRRPLPLQQELL